MAQRWPLPSTCGSMGSGAWAACRAPLTASPASPASRPARPQLVHGDVFRFPPHLNLFCAVVGTGTQILVMALLIFGMSLLGTYYPYNGGAMLTSVVVFYALTAGIAGYVSAALYKIMGGEARSGGGGPGQGLCMWRHRGARHGRPGPSRTPSRLAPPAHLLRTAPPARPPAQAPTGCATC